MSNPARIEYDIERARELATILDEERGIPDDARLANYYDTSKYPHLTTAMVIIIFIYEYIIIIYLYTPEIERGINIMGGEIDR